MKCRTNLGISMILSAKSTLRAPTSELEPFAPYKESNAPINGLEEVERDHILRWTQVTG